MTPETYKQWFETLQAEQALERAKLLAAQGAGPSVGDRAKRLTGRAFFDQRAAGQLGIADGDDGEGEEEEDDEDDDPDFELGEDECANLCATLCEPFARSVHRSAAARPACTALSA